MYIFVYYAPNFEEVWEAYWFGPVRPSVRLYVTLALGQEPLNSRNLVCRMSMKIKRPVFFSLSIGFVIAELLPFSFFFYIISLWKLVNKISQEPLKPVS